MANPPPLELGRTYHIYNRGNNGENLFRADSDYRIFLQQYRRHIEPVCETFAYCLMPNHVHLIAVPATEAGLRLAIGEAHRRYTGESTSASAGAGTCGRAASRPSWMAHTTSDWPRRASPAANTLGWLVLYSP